MFKKSFFILLLVMSGSLQAGETVVQQLQRFLDDTRSLSAKFEQKLLDRYGALVQQSAGHLSLQRPGRFRWDYILPYPQNIISNGQRIWMYDSELEQVTVRPYDQLLASSPVRLLDSNQRLQQAFDVEAMPESDGQQWVRLAPRERDSDFTEMHIGLSKGRIRTMRFIDNFNQQTEIYFKELVLNPSFKSSRFEFEVPPGVDIVGDF